MPIQAVRKAAQCLLASVLGAAPPFPGQEGPPTKVLFRSYAQREGLSDLSAEKLTQDSLGRLWIGAQRGLYQYDGVRFLAYGVKEGLPSTYVTCLESTMNGKVWIGTWEGLAVRSGQKILSAKDVPSFPTDRILALAKSRDDMVWVATAKGLFAGTETGFRPVHGWPKRKADAVAMGPEGQVWASSGSHLLHQGHFGEWEEWDLRGCLQDERIESILCNSAGGVFIRSTRKIAFKPSDSRQFMVITDSLSGTRLFSGPLRLDEEDNLWAPTEEGLVSFSGGRWKAMGQKQGLPASSIQDLMFDREGSLWIAGQGVHRMLGNNTWKAATSLEGMPGDKIWIIARDDKGRLLVGANRGLVRAGQDRWERLPGLEDISCMALAVDSKGNLWAAGTRGNLRLLEKGASKAKPMEDILQLKNYRILTLLCDKQDRLWAGTDEGGLLLKPPQKGAVFAKVELPGGHLRERINHIIQDGAGRIWVAGQEGLARLENGKWERFTTRNGLKQNHVLHLAQRKNMLHLSYFDELGYSNFLVQEGFHLQEHENLQATVSAIGVDGKGRIWLGTDKGAVLQSAKTRRHFRASDGMVGEDCNQGALLVDDDGDAWIGTSTGLAHIGNPEGIPADITPGINITEITLGGHSVWPIPPTPLKARRRNPNLTVLFAPRSFSMDENLMCEYRLLGLENQWQKTRAGEAHFTRLSHGSYEFQVRAHTEYGGQGPVSSLRIIVPAAWWQILWLQSALILTIAALTTHAVTKHIKRLRRNNMDLEALLSLADTLTRDLEATNLSLQEQSLTDPLTGLRNRRFLDSTIHNDLALLERQRRKPAEAQDQPPKDNIDMLFFMVDVDHFKWVNDTLGHGAGDAVLEQLSRVLRAATRGSDTVIRWGGEEFLVMARQTRRQDAPVLAERIRKSVENHRFELPNGGFIRRTCSIGFAPFPLEGIQENHQNWEQAVNLADQCMYQAKTEGRNRWIGLAAPECPVQGASIETTNPDLNTILEAGLAVQMKSQGLEDLGQDVSDNKVI